MGSSAQTYIHILWRGGLDEYRERKRREREEERRGVEKREVHRPQDNEKEGIKWREVRRMEKELR